MYKQSLRLVFAVALSPSKFFLLDMPYFFMFSVVLMVVKNMHMLVVKNVSLKVKEEASSLRSDQR